MTETTHNNLIPEAVAVAQQALADALKTLGATPLAQRGLEAATRRAVRAYLAASVVTPSKKGGGRLNPGTVACMAMRIGESRDFPFEPSHVWAQRFHTARKRMKIDARWRIDQHHDRTTITRTADSEPVNPGTPGPRAIALSQLAVGGRVILPGKHPLSQPTKQSARRVMGKPYANWKTTKTNKGLRAERIA